MTEPDPAAGRTWRPVAKQVVKVALLGLVLVFVTRHVLQTGRDLNSRDLALSFDPRWLLGAGVLYLLGMVAFGVYFQRVLVRSPTPVGLYPAIRAYLVSHLAKYVPGKAMVVVVRSGLVAEAGARPASAAFATLYETLVMMAAGGLIATVGFCLIPDRHPAPRGVIFGDIEARLPDFPRWIVLALLGLGAGLGFLVLVWPKIFPILAGLIRKPLRGVGADVLPRLSGRLLVEGLLWSALGWILLGLSQVAVIAGVWVGSSFDHNLVPTDWPVVVASVALATVVGFAIPIAPGGLGVREYVLWEALGTTLSNDRAVVAALVLRLVWVATEIAAAAALYWVRPRSRGTA